MNKKVGILTSSPSFINNYGAILQAYALETQLKKMGYIPKIIKYAGSNEYEKGKTTFRDRMHGVIFNSKLSMRCKAKIILNKILNRSVYPVFLDFQNKYLDFYNNEYISYSKLHNLNDEFGAFVVGSDQVWNPLIHGGENDPGYFLQFVEYDAKKIAYAPSFGITKLPESCKQDLKKYLESFDSLSVREQSGADIIRDECGITVQTVLDPTLLLDDITYNSVKIMPEKLTQPYLVHYMFGNSKSIEKIVTEISKRYNLQVICIPAGLDTKFSPDYSIGPKEFIGLIGNASLVCTDSFHATVFSIIYNRPFVSFSRASGASMNTRLISLLNSLELDDRYVGTGENIDSLDVMNLDFQNANKKLKEKKNESLEFLSKALS